MKTRMYEPETGSITVRLGNEGSELRIPRVDAEAQCTVLAEELVWHARRHTPSTWVIDLSEYEEGISLALAGALAGFREEARRQGCEVRFTELKSGLFASV